MSPSLADPAREDLTQRRRGAEPAQSEKQIRVDPPNPPAIDAGASISAWPVETDIYILPDGRVVVADLPAELAGALARLGQIEPCEITDYDRTDSTA
jgi:hypothetical protein